MHIDILLESRGQLHLDTFLCKVVDVQLHQKVADRKALCLNILSHQVFQKKRHESNSKSKSKSKFNLSEVSHGHSSGISSMSPENSHEGKPERRKLTE